MKTRKHGNGLTHGQVIRFSNRLAFQGVLNREKSGSDYADGYDDGWRRACQYFAHVLRAQLREFEIECSIPDE